MHLAKKIEFSFKSYDKTTDIISGRSVSESMDLYLSEKDAKTLKIIISESGVKKLRLSGKFQNDYVLDESKVEALLDVLNHYYSNKTIK